jgi:hypothetical protein
MREVGAVLHNLALVFTGCAQTEVALELREERFRCRVEKSMQIERGL